MPKKNKIGDLRDHLFETLEALKDTESPMDLDRAKAISEVAQTIINSAKVEIDLLKVVGGSAPGTDFLEIHSADLPQLRLAEGRKPA